MITLDPVTVGSSPFTVPLWSAGQLGSPPSAVRVANESPYALQISVAGSDHWLQAWTADVYPAQGAGKILVSPSLLTTAAAPPSSQLLVSVAEQGETFPGAYPLALDRVTSISAGTVDIGTITGPVTISGGPISVTDGGLAETTVALSTQFAPVHDQPLVPGTTQIFAAGAGQSFAYPSGAASWQLIILGLQSAGYGCRVAWKGVNTGVGGQRDTQQGVWGGIIASGVLNDTAMQWSVTLPSGAPAGCNALLYMSGAAAVQDNWYDSAIYGPSFNLPAGAAGYDGILLRVNSTLGAGANATYGLPTFRGPVYIGVNGTQALHGVLQMSDYLGSVVSVDYNFPISASGPGRQQFPSWLPGVNNAVVLFNDDTGATNTFELEVRAAKDLL